jgi:alkanesulfonate monooxygenase SsuD/methylene tetrahydromethanopterin reductase-like flavin-dependent oxidoreductase (luciferase family)
MFGVEQREHDERYVFAEEWLDIIKRAWSDEPDDFHHKGRWFDLANVRTKPKPVGGARPLIMNAGSSGAGQRFALRNCDAFFTATGASRSSLDGIARRVDEVKAEAHGYGKEIDVYTIGQVICRPSQKEAEDYHRHANVDQADWEAVERMLALRNITRANTSPDEYQAKRVFFAANSIGGYPFVGTPEKIAEELAVVSRAGVRGIAVSFVNYLDELPLFRDEVLPRLVRMGLRMAV